MPSPLNPNQDSELRKKLKIELERTILVEPADRDFWLSRLETLPIYTVKNLLNILVDRNARVDSFMQTALAQDKNQEHLKDFRKKISQIKKKAFQIEEKEESKGKTEEEEKLLQKLDEP